MKKPQPDQTPNDADARARLLEAATNLFNSRGYAATTVREIVEAAGVTKPVLYYYFGSKEGIFLEILGGPLETYEEVLRESRSQGGNARDRILRLCDRTLALFESNIPVVRLLNSVYYGPPQGAPFIDVDSYHVKFHSLLREIITQGIRGGEFRRIPVDDAMWAIIGALNIAMEVQLCHPEMALGRSGLRKVLSAVFDGLGRTREPGSRGTGAPGKKRKVKT